MYTLISLEKTDRAHPDLVLSLKEQISGLNANKFPQKLVRGFAMIIKCIKKTSMGIDIPHCKICDAYCADEICSDCKSKGHINRISALPS